MYRRNSIFGSSNQRKEVQKRTWTIMSVFILLFCFFIWKITNYMYFKAEPLKTMANAQYTIEEKYGSQYSLTDCKGMPLLDYAINYYAIIDPVDYLRFNEYTSKYDLQALAITLRSFNSDYDLEKIKSSGNGQKIRYKIDSDTYDKLKDIKSVKGFYIYAANDVMAGRVWKIENLISNPKYYKEGVKDPIFKSDSSIEMQIYNKTKNNEFTKIKFVKGIDGEISEGKIIEPENNVNVRLTLDKEIQDSALDILHSDKYKKYDQIGIILMESKNGKIRAMAQKDDSTYNANLGIPTTNGAFPGSIFKVVVEEAGLDMNLIDKNEIFPLNRTYFPKAHETLIKQYTLGEALTYSSNNTFAQIGRRVGLKNMYNYAEKQGLFRKVLNFQQEDIGTFGVDVSTSDPGEKSHTAIGQKTRITPLEAISIPNTIINNGIYVQPSIIDAYVNDNNQIIEEFTSETTRVLKRETAETVKLHMMNVVKKGTGTEAYIKDMSIGGKTGTTEYYVNGKEYSDGWFVGFFNLRGKSYSMVVFVEHIELSKEEGLNSQGGGDTAAPIFKEVVNALKAID
ncbi:MAG: penicillin-binding transpeptidase domain-containing protein [Clostridium sp.]|uniref:penicillin-binding transpeptidase domain-containing protein n=1 Tax=Clostridium sp. TaxID=1506 RepID=UPI003D6CF81B